MYNIPVDSVVEFDYVNWRGEAERRKVVFHELTHGKNEFHTDFAFFLTGFCLDRMQRRTFKIANISPENFVLHQN